MAKYNRSSKSNPCPVCSKTNGNCRTVGQELVLCMTHQEDDFSHLGLKYIGKTKDGLWGKFIYPSEDYSAERKLFNQKVRDEKEKAEKAKFSQGLTIAQRDKQIRTVCKYLGLTSAHHKELTRRGLNSDQIEKGLFFSVVGYAELPNFIDERLSGVFVGKNGKKYLKGHPEGSIACVAFHGDKAVGIQLRHPRKDNKYTWLKGIKSSHLNNGELPLTHLKMNDGNELWITEGILKPFITSAKFGLNVVGASGFNIPSEQFKQIIQDEGYTRIIFGVDANTPNNKNILERLRNNINLAIESGVNADNIFVAWWGQESKTDKDIDELDNLQQVKLIPSGEFLDKTDKDLNKKEFTKKKKQLLHELTKFTPDITFNARYVSEKLSELDFIGKINCVQAIKGSGKSFFLKTLKNLLRIPFIIIGNRVKLGQQLTNDLKINWVGDDFNKDLVASLVNGGQSFGINIDSLSKLEGLDLSEYFGIADEVNQLNETLGISNTHIAKRRGRVWATLGNIAKQCQGMLIMDADLSDRVCDYWARLAPNKHLQKVLNTYQDNQGRKLFLFSHPTKNKAENKKGLNNLLAKLDKKAKRGEKLLIMSDKEKDLNALYNQYKDTNKCVLITAPSIANDEELNRYLKHKGAMIKGENVQMVFCSPVIQSGISFELENYFSAVFGIFGGVVNSNIIRQMLRRDRSNAPRYVWCDKYGAKFKHDYQWQKIRQDREESDNWLLEIINYFQKVEKLTKKEAVLKLAELMDKNDDVLTVNLDNVAQCLALENLNKSMLLELLIEELIAEGYTVSLNEEIAEKDLLSPYQEMREGLLVKESNRIFIAEDIDEITANLLSKKPSLTDEERAKLIKYRILQTIPDYELTPDFILAYIVKDNFKLINSIKNYHLAQHPEVAEKLDFNSVNYAVSQSAYGGVIYFGDNKKFSLLTNIWTELKLDELTNGIYTIEQLKEVLDNVSPKTRGILRTYGIRWGKTSSIGATIKNILKLFGFTLTTAKKVKGVRSYKAKKIELLPNQTHWGSIFESIKVRFGTVEINHEYLDEINEYLTLDSKDFNEGARFNEGAKITSMDYNDSGKVAPYSNQDTATDTVNNTQSNAPPIQESGGTDDNFTSPVPTLCSSEKEKIGKLVNYLHPTKGVLRGIIQKIDDIAYWVEDCISFELTPCAVNQVELLGVR